MSYKKLQHTHNQHTVPICFLKNFSDDKIRIFQKLKKIHIDFEVVNNELKNPISLKNKATVEKDFYTIKSGREPMLVETMIYDREIENHYPRIYDLLINPQVKGFKMEERTRLLMCLLSLHCRTPKQFRLFFDTMIPESALYEMDKIKEDYKGVHVKDILPNFIAAHQFKIIRIAKINDTSEFITSDNPVLIVDSKGNLMNHKYREQFNIDNKILIPLDKKHCCILTNATDKNGISIYNKVFCNIIERIEVDCSFTQNINYLMLGSADKYYYGSERYMKAFFSIWKLV
jgi:hypothetical protein